MKGLWTAGAALALAACGGGGAGQGNAHVDGANQAAPGEASGTEAANGTTTAAAGAAGAGGMSACPFRETRNLAASVEGGRALVTANVDFQMAGFRPELSRRDDSSPPVLRLDLTLAPAPGEPVTDTLRYQAPASGFRRLEIHCGGKVLGTADMVVI